MIKLWAAVIVSVMAVSALCQAPPAIYEAVRAVKAQGITLKSWGSGTIAETDESAWEGNWSIRVSTRNYYQGGVIDLANAVDLSGSYGDKNNLLRVMLCVPTASTTYGGSGNGLGKGGPGNMPGMGPGNKGGGPGNQGGGPGSQGSGPGSQGGMGSQGLSPGGGGQGLTKGGRGGGGTSSTQDLPLKTIRVIVVTTDGKRSEAYVPIPETGKADNGYRPLAVPLRAISGFDKTNKIVKELWLSADSVGTFYVGDIAVVNDATPITGEMNPRQDVNLALGDEIKLTAVGYGGASVLHYAWNFGEGTDPTQVDAEGQVVTHKFRQPGTFTVAVTISDKFGLKKPYTTSVKITVNP